MHAVMKQCLADIELFDQSSQVSPFGMTRLRSGDTMALNKNVVTRKKMIYFQGGSNAGWQRNGGWVECFWGRVVLLSLMLGQLSLVSVRLWAH